MTALEFWLMLILYCFLVVIVYKKQLKACSKVLYTSTGEQKFFARLAAFFAPITIVWYAVRAVFFEDWL